MGLPDKRASPIKGFPAALPEPPVPEHEPPVASPPRPAREMGQRRCGGALALLATCLALVCRSLPVGDAGPHVRHGWGEPVRLRRLYSRGGLYLSIGGDGRVEGTEAQGLHSLLQITSVSAGTVAIKGVLSSRYLCMEEAGRLQGRLIYSTEDCSFEEEILAGYNAYKSKKYGVLVTLRSARQRQVKGKDSHPFSHFMPMITTMPVESMGFGEYGDSRPSFESRIFNSRLDNDNPDPFGITSDTAVQSPSFEK